MCIRDSTEIEDRVKQGLNIHFVKHVDEALRVALVKCPKLKPKNSTNSVKEAQAKESV